jgi:hypothetical protein
MSCWTTHAWADNPCVPGTVISDTCEGIPNYGCCENTSKIWCDFASNSLCSLQCEATAPGCGDKICADEEDHDSCPDDCSTGCGNDNCGLFENSVNCPKDCGTICGDGSCYGEETVLFCPNDCKIPTPYCGWNTDAQKLSCLETPNEQSPIGSTKCDGGPEPCDTATFSGCCNDGNTLVFCEDNFQAEVDCKSNGDPTKNQCGWLISEGRYGCVELGLAEASGAVPFLCPGSEGCAYDCVDKQCGSDNCGGTCGECPDGTHCEDTLCICTPVCDGLQCGPDSCEGSCGDCPVDLTCNPESGQCVDCVPDCTGRECGSDGCDGTCGECFPGQVCNFQAGVCEGNCTTLCDVKECGDDGCGGTCGECGPGKTCLLAGICVSVECITECEGLECGINNCGDPCGVCSPGTSCSSSGFCIDGSCIPACSNRVCGPDGCSGLCGICQDEELCVAGLCVPKGSSGPDTGGGFGDQPKGSSGCAINGPASPLSMILLLLALFSLKRREEQ